MATDTFQTSNATSAWDKPANWSLGTTPQPGDTAVINAPASGYSTVSIAASDPAYTVQALSMTGAGSNSITDQLAVNGSLTVTGTTTLNYAGVTVSGGGQADFGTVNLGSSSGLNVGSFAAGQPGSLTVTTLSGQYLDDLEVISGTASIGTAAGSFDINLRGGTLSVGTTSGTIGLIFRGGALALGTTANSLSDEIEYLQAATVDLTSLAFQQGETVQVVANPAGSVQSYSAIIHSAQGNTLFTFNYIQPGTAGSGVPLVNVSRDGAGDTLVSIACYTPGTLIGIPSGEVAAGDLRIGDRVLTLSGVSKPVVWIGRRSYAGRFLARQPHLLPIRIEAGALGGGLPRRDLLVSPCHAMFLDGVLVPAASLVNGRTIRQEVRADRVDYIHIELAEHDVIFAEGAPSETFLDDDSRTAFHNASEYAALYGDLVSPQPAYYAPRLTDGFTVEAIRGTAGTG